MKRIGEIGSQLRRALNEQKSFVTTKELSDAIYEASNTVFGHKRGHSALYRPGQPVPPQGYQLTTVLDVALNPFLQIQRYTTQDPQAGELPWAPDGTLLFPRKTDPITNIPTDENFFQYPVSLTCQGVRGWRKANDNALAQILANSLTAPTSKLPVYVSVPGGYRLYFGATTLPVPFVDLGFLGAPPRCKYAEKNDPKEQGSLIYDDAASIDIGWQDVTCINEIIAFATRSLGGQVKDQQAISLASQTTQMGA